MLKLFGKGKKNAAEEKVTKAGGKKSDLLNFNALEVTDFSSQYGSETSISYTASNLAGRGNIYPSYGDYTQACVFRTYGDWWDIAPSKRQAFYRTPPSFCSQDYIELSFQRKVYPVTLEIYETYNPGCVVRILACERSADTDVDTGQHKHRWKTLWEGEPALPVPESPGGSPKARIFSPPLRKCPFPTDLIRIELCHKLVHYYTELDYVLLNGTVKPLEIEDKNWSEAQQASAVFEAFVNLALTPSREVASTQEVSAVDKGDNSTVDKGDNSTVDKGDNSAVDKGDNSNIGRTETEGGEQETAGTESDNGNFDMLPEEVIQLILSFLDVLSLCRVARTCRLLHQHSYDSLQYTELNLQPYWTQVNDVALHSLESRSRFLQRLNLSWCHGNILSNDAFCRYVHSCGVTLKCLYLSSCNFLNTASIKAITESCPGLVELDLDSCRRVQSSGLAHIAGLKNLERLNLYRSVVDIPSILSIVRSCPELQHLNLGSCTCINHYDEVLTELGQCCGKLRSLDIWRSLTVTHVGLGALAAGCPDLEDLDLGWCPNIKSGTGCIVNLVEKCPKLKKLFLTANRTLCDSDMIAVAKHCPDLEQLDILGTSQVSAETAQRVLESCKKLVFFDVSFCSGIDNYTVNIWTREYPHVRGIKKSFQN